VEAIRSCFSFHRFSKSETCRILLARVADRIHAGPVRFEWGPVFRVNVKPAKGLIKISLCKIQRAARLIQMARINSEETAAMDAMNRCSNLAGKGSKQMH
jgi:hypothetical protein